MKSFDQIIEIACGVIVSNAKGDILLVTGPKWKGLYTIVGGHIEYGEKIEDGVRRELQEEIGIVPERIEFLSLNEAVFPEWFHRTAHFIFLNFVGWVGDEKQLTLSKNEFSNWIWIDPKEALKTVPLVGSLPEVLRTYISTYQRNV